MKSLNTFIKENHLENSSELVFFGGSFHPWHAGHSECIRLLPDEKKLIVIPDHSPHKELTTTENKFSTPSDILRKLQDFSKSIYLFDGFWHMNRVNPTVMWVEELKKDFPLINISLLIGFDSFKTISNWTHADVLLNSLHSLYVVSRLETKEEEELYSKKIKELNPNIKLKFLGHHPYEHVSSTDIRRR